MWWPYEPARMGADSDSRPDIDLQLAKTGTLDCLPVVLRPSSLDEGPFSTVTC